MSGGEVGGSGKQGVGTLTQMTFAMAGEDHTLGNALRCLLAGRLDVEFAGYAIPHPTSDEMNFRLQTVGGRPAVAVMREGLDDLVAVCDHLIATWNKSVQTRMTDF